VRVKPSPVKKCAPGGKVESHWTTPHAGGDGAARDAVEYILKAQGKWKKGSKITFQSVGVEAKGNSQTWQVQTPTDRLLGGVLGLATGGLLFSLLTLFFQDIDA